MMTDRLYIDGYDAYKQWGVYVVAGGWNEAIAYAPLKTVEYNDWQEEDGIEADLSDPKLNTKEISLNFAYAGLYSGIIEFVNLLADGAYHEFNCAHIRRQYTLRMTQMPNLDHASTLGFVTIKFSNDFPLKGYSYKAPSSRVMRAEDYLIDGVPFTDYGCRILQGSLSEVMKSAAVKQNLLRNIASQPGAIYDDAAVTYKSKDVKLNCLMRAETLDELWRNYDALLFDLIRPDERMLEVTELEQTFPCFYKSASVSEFFPEDKIWLRFTLTLTFTHSFRIDGGDVVLASEDRIVVFTENNLFAIDMTADDLMLFTEESENMVVTEMDDSGIDMVMDFMTYTPLNDEFINS